MEINDYIKKIKVLGACGEAVEQAHNYKTSQELWNDCKRGDWMLWLIGKQSGKPESDKRRRLVITACKCARLALPYAGENKDVALKTIETAEKWANNQSGITIKDVRAAADAASYDADAYADAAYVAAYAAYAAADAADAADAAYAADAAAYAADAAYAAKEKILSECADIVRIDYPDVDKLW